MNKNIDDFFNRLINVNTSDIDEVGRLRDLFKTIILDWNTINDIDENLVDEIVIMKILKHCDQFIEELTNGESVNYDITDKLLKAPRVLKKRIL